MKGMYNYKIMYMFIYKRVKRNVYNDQYYKDFVYELGIVYCVDYKILYLYIDFFVYVVVIKNIFKVCY